MSIFELMERNKKEFTKNDKTIYAYLSKYPEDFLNSQLAAISAYTGVSHASITRFIQKLGFSNLNEFRYQLSIDLQEKDKIKEKKSRAQIYSETLLEAEKMITDEILEKIYLAFESHRNICLTGYNLSRIPAEHMNSLLSISVPYSSRVLMNDTLPHVIEDDNVLIIYSTRRSEFYKDWLEKIKENEKKPYVILVTMNSKHKLRKFADLTVLLPSADYSQMGDVVNADQLSFMFFNHVLDTYIVNRNQSEQK